MKINCVLIGLILCGGGGGAGAAGGITVQTSASIAFSCGTRVLIGDKLHVLVDGAQHTGSDHAYIARRDQNYVAIAVQLDDKPFVEVLGNLGRLGGRLSKVMTGNLIFEVRHSMAQWISVYR
jgi:hypothetical protein